MSELMDEWRLDLPPIEDVDLAPLGVLDRAEISELVLNERVRAELGGQRVVATRSSQRAAAWVVFTRHRITCPGGVDPAVCGCGANEETFHAYLADSTTEGALPVRPELPPGPRRCKDCPPDSTRPAPHRGPRCTQHHRAYVAREKRANYGRHIKALFSVTIDEYDAIKASQGGKCAICQRATGASKRLTIDHDHKTKLIRGLLCSHCNKFLGWARDDPEVFRRAYKYLTDPPAVRVIGERHTDDNYRTKPAEEAS